MNGYLVPLPACPAVPDQFTAGQAGSGAQT
jgi:hypothetical protein